MQTTVYLFTIKHPKDKVALLFEKCSYHFCQNEPLLILCPDKRAIDFVDTLLWNYQASTFIPHSRSFEALEKLIIHEEELPYTGKNLFNLKPFIPFKTKEMHLIYDFEDLNNKEKEKESALRYKEYKRLGCQIICAEI